MGVRLVLTKGRVIRALIQVIQIVLAHRGNLNKSCDIHNDISMEVLGMNIDIKAKQNGLDVLGWRV